MTVFEFITQSPDILAAAIFGFIEQTEEDTVQKIYCATGITIDTMTLAPEIRIEGLRRDLLNEMEVPDADT